MEQFKEIVRFEENGKFRRFLFKDGDPNVYDETDGKVTRYGEIKFFVQPYVPRPEDMRSHAARVLTTWCKNKIEGGAIG
jgi:hypothetical protein